MKPAHLKECNAVAQALLEPFDDSELSSREENGMTFSYVSPEKYRYRLLRVFGTGFAFGLTDVVEGKEGVRAIAHFHGAVDGEDGVPVTYKVDGVPVFERWTVKSDGTVINRDKTYSSLTSAGYKGIARELGVGLHMYDKPGGKAPAGKSAAAKPAAAKTGAAENEPGAVGADGWDGTETVNFGAKQKGKRYCDVEQSWIAWAASKDNPDAGAVKELARRQGAAAQGAAEGAAQTDDNDVPF